MPADLHNRLEGTSSPYLRQHADNPVAWQPWDAQALAQARAEDRPILLSIGYSACHWCHVMAHESFEDVATAAVMNRLFINIKVDREERPDLDQVYQSAHQMLTGRPGGWPLTMFLSPDGVPFHGGTYFPRTARYGLPGFVDLCQRVAKAWETRRQDIATQNRELLSSLAHLAPTAFGTVDLSGTPIHALRDWLLGQFDREHGGFGGAPKFPQPGDLAFLISRRDDSQAQEAVLLALDRMADGGIHDQLGGGFCRYSVDERWEIPHFEKMLYDNAALLALYADAWQMARQPRYREVAEGIVDWLGREMTAPEGGFYAALDADAEGEEGKFYVWDRGELAALLTPEESALAGRHWGLAGPPNFEGQHWHLKVAAPLAAEDVPLRDAARAKLFAARAQRIRPGLDDKILTAWNALMIKGFARAARRFDMPDWIAPARAALGFLQSHHWHDGRLMGSSCRGSPPLPAFLDDHAYLLDALLELLQTEFRPEDLGFAVMLADGLLKHFADDEHGGFFFTAHDHEALIQRPKPGHDAALPSGNGVAAHALQRLGHLLGETRYLEAARRTLECFWPRFASYPGGHATLITALEEALAPPAIVILRGPAADLPVWHRRISGYPGVMALMLPNGLAGLPSALAKPETEVVNAWLCRGVTCHTPVDDPDGLDRLLTAEFG